MLPGSSFFRNAPIEIVRDNLESSLRFTRGFTRDNYRKPVPLHVERELRRYVDCGQLPLGSTRLRCARCGRDMRLAFCLARDVLAAVAKSDPEPQVREAARKAIGN